MVDIDAEVKAECSKLFRQIGDEVAKSACFMMAGLLGDLAKAKQRRVMQHRLRAAESGVDER